MVRVFKYRAYLSRAQQSLFAEQLETCRGLYNNLLSLNIELYKKNKFSLVGKFQGLLKYLKLYDLRLVKVHSHVLQDVCERLNKAFQSFFRRVKSGEKPGFPRFKDKDRYHSFGYTYMGFKLLPELGIRVSKLGDLKLKLHRKLPELSRSLEIVLSKTASNKYYVSICCEVPDVIKSLPKTGKILGIDLGISSYLTTHEGQKIKNPKHLAKKLDELKITQKKLSKQKKGSPERQKTKGKLQRLFEKVANQRHDRLHKLSRELVNENDVICVEDLNIKNMMKHDKEKEKDLSPKEKKNKRGLRRNASDAAWNSFTNMLVYKAAEAGRQVVKVDPRNTTKMCSSCGRLVPKALHERVHECPDCGLKLDRDHNAAINILRLGMQSLADVSVA
jgi:putative transposase